MKANELRIGNYVIEFHTVVKITSIGIEYIKTDRGLTKINHPANILPIPLTEGVLLKSGFISMENNEIFEHSKFSLKCDISDKSVCISDSWEWKDVEFVHQLQNLIFALTGEELEINCDFQIPDIKSNSILVGEYRDNFGNIISQIFEKTQK